MVGVLEITTLLFREDLMSERFVESQTLSVAIQWSLRAGIRALLVIDMQADFWGRRIFASHRRRLHADARVHQPIRKGAWRRCARRGFT